VGDSLVRAGISFSTFPTEGIDSAGTQVEVDSDSLAPWTLDQIARVHGSSTAHLLTAHCDHIARGGRSREDVGVVNV
jgi:hypothetical protein